MLAFAAFLLLFAQEGGVPTVEAGFEELRAECSPPSKRMRPTRSTPSSAIYEGAVPGMLRRLDPFSVFFDPRPVRSAQGTGEIDTQRIRERCIAVARTSHRFADVARHTIGPLGMNPGDEIVVLNGIPLDRLDMDQLDATPGPSRGISRCSFWSRPARDSRAAAIGPHP